VALTLTVALEPERLNTRLTLAGIPAGSDTFTIERTSPSGHTAGVRGAVDAPVTGTSEIVRDYEAPFDIALTYKATVYDGATVVGTVSATFTVTFDECEAWFVDLARPTNSLELVVENLNELDFASAVGVHRILNRRAPVLTTLPAWTPSGELNAITETLEQRDAMRALLGSGYPFLLRTSPDMGIGNIYFGVTDFVEERFLALGWEAQRRFRVACVQVERPNPAVFVPQAPNTYANVKTSFATYAALKAAVGTYDELAYTYPGGEASPIIPWLPDDV
jgi:hypothetical protein